MKGQYLLSLKLFIWKCFRGLIFYFKEPDTLSEKTKLKKIQKRFLLTAVKLPFAIDRSMTFSAAFVSSMIVCLDVPRFSRVAYPSSGFPTCWQNVIPVIIKAQIRNQRVCKLRPEQKMKKSHQFRFKQKIQLWKGCQV